MHNVVWHPAELRCWSGAALGKCMACNTWFHCMKISNYQITIGLFGKIFKNHVACFCAFTLDYQATKEQVGECSAKRLSWGQVFQFYETQTFFAEHPNLRFCPKKTLFLLEILFVSCMWLGASPRKQPVMGPVGHSRRSEGRKKGLWRKMNWTYARAPFGKKARSCQCSSAISDFCAKNAEDVKLHHGAVCQKRLEAPMNHTLLS